MSSTDALLSARGLRKQYGALVVLDGVDFEVRRGDAIGIVGPNGAGKTTLLSLLSGSQAATAGTMAFKGHDVSSLDAASRCRMGIVRTHQVPQPFSGMTVFENVFTAATHGGGFRRKEAYERCIDAIELCGMTKVANRRAETLGLLDRKRLELTRALATNPQVLLLDESVAGSPTVRPQNSCRPSRCCTPGTSPSSGSSISCMCCCRWHGGWSAWTRAA
jgi:branched-chain amino acid transport system ATP-binding protein